MKAQSLMRSMGISLALALVLSAGTLHAQGASTPQISDRELAAFAKAYTEVQQIRLEYEPALQKTKDPKQSERLQQEANARLKKTLDREGLSVDRYNQIYAVVNANDELRRKTLKMIEQDRKKS